MDKEAKRRAHQKCYRENQKKNKRNAAFMSYAQTYYPWVVAGFDLNNASDKKCPLLLIKYNTYTSFSFSVKDVKKREESETVSTHHLLLHNQVFIFLSITQKFTPEIQSDVPLESTPSLQTIIQELELNQFTVRKRQITLASNYSKFTYTLFFINSVD